MTSPEIDGDALWGTSAAEGNRDGLKGGAAAPDGVGGPYEHDVVGDETDETQGPVVS